MVRSWAVMRLQVGYSGPGLPQDAMGTAVPPALKRNRRDMTIMPRRPICRGCDSLVLRHCEAAHMRFGVVSEAESVHAIRGLELPWTDRRRLVVRADDLPVDSALDLVAL